LHQTLNINHTNPHSNPMKFVKFSQSEFKEIRKLYEGVMAQACHGLFFREGMILGEEISRIALQEPEKYFEICGNLLRARGWVDNIMFQESSAVVDGSFESSDSADEANCHRLRGIIRKMYESHFHKRMHCEEMECVSRGDAHCVFKLEYIGGD
jgi:predicted hydrocarbon binding protein